MAKMRVHELAKEIDMASKDLIALLSDMGIDGKTASSSLEEDQIEQVRKKAGKKSVPKADKAEKPEKAVKAEKPEKAE
ncbi:MAG: translation initiation factor IF-2 N-terminal domain-containing protein, partial [Lachnospiraceae bacterium]|nr:translation initiation factor IF-2 N-terminal domain-containing protein [Lachnospiraceae bacterium]